MAFLVSANLSLDASLNGSLNNSVDGSDRRCNVDVNVSVASSRRRSSVGSTCSDWFNTTREEMILYERFGEDYDEVNILNIYKPKEKRLRTDFYAV